MKTIRESDQLPVIPLVLITRKRVDFELLEVEKNTGIQLTEGYTMYPAASVSGFYYAHPQSQYFVLGNIDEEQLNDYVTRKNIDLEKAKKNSRA